MEWSSLADETVQVFINFVSTSAHSPHLQLHHTTTNKNCNLIKPSTTPPISSLFETFQRRKVYCSQSSQKSYVSYAGLKIEMHSTTEVQRRTCYSVGDTQLKILKMPRDTAQYKTTLNWTSLKRSTERTNSSVCILTRQRNGIDWIGWVDEDLRQQVMKGKMNKPFLSSWFGWWQDMEYHSHLAVCLWLLRLKRKAVLLPSG